MADDTQIVVAGGDLIALARDLESYAHAGRAASTRRVYASAWRGFAAWCERQRLEALPAHPGTVALYLTAHAGRLSVSTLARHLAAIAAQHVEAGHAPPAHADLASVWAGIKRTHGRPPRKKRALVVEDLRRVVAKLPDSLSGKRDRALLLVGFLGALRRSELAILSLPGPGCGPVRAEFVSHGLEIHVDRAKGDQEGRGAIVAIPFGKKICGVGALQAWIAAAQIRSGPIFRSVDRHGRLGTSAMSDRAVADVVKAACARVGLDPAMFAGHSLRSGLLTSAAEKGAAPDVLQGHGRHKKFDTTRGYIQAGDRFKRNAAGKVGL